MSAFDDGGMGNVLRPLTHSLIRNIPQPPQIMPGMDNPAMQLQTAAGYKPRGQAATSQAGTGVRGPMAGHLYKSVMLKQAGLSEDEMSDYGKLAEDPQTTPQMLHQLLQMRPKAQSQPAGPQQPNGGASIGGAAAAGTAPGSIQVTRGHGPNGMSEEAMSQWAHRVAGQQGEGEHFSRVQNEEVPRHSFFQKPTGFGAEPGSKYAGRGDITRGPLQGFQVNDIKPPVEPQPAQQPIDPKAAHEAQQLQHQQQTEERAGRREDAANKHAQFQENKAVLDELQKQQKEALEAHPELVGGSSNDPNVMKDWQALQQQQQAVRQRLQQAVTPQQSQLPTPPQPGHPLDPQGAQHFMQAAGGDKNKARALAKQAGWSF